jgi:hypothetical protein
VELFARHLEAADPETRRRKHLASLAVQYPDFAEQLKTMMHEPRSLWRFEMIGCLVASERSYVLFGTPSAREGTVPGYEPIPDVAVVIERVEGLRLAHDPSPYSGVAFFQPAVPVLDSNGEMVDLHLLSDEI